MSYLFDSEPASGHGMTFADTDSELQIKEH
jgi:hypothetical protein